MAVHLENFNFRSGALKIGEAVSLIIPAHKPSHAEVIQTVLVNPNIAIESDQQRTADKVYFLLWMNILLKRL